MPRHVLSIEEQLRGMEKALANPNTPKQFKPAMEARANELRKQLRKTERQETP